MTFENSASSRFRQAAGTPIPSLISFFHSFLLLFVFLVELRVRFHVPIRGTTGIRLVYPSLRPSILSVMAVYPLQSTARRSSVLPAQPTQPINILAWTEQATESLQALSVTSPRATRGTSAPLSISIDEHTPPRPDQSTAHRADSASETHPSAPRRPLLRRDSLDRRNVLLKGKEGSRRRQRWENGSCQPSSPTALD